MLSTTTAAVFLKIDSLLTIYSTISWDSLSLCYILYIFMFLNVYRFCVTYVLEFFSVYCFPLNKRYPNVPTCIKPQESPAN